MSDYTAKESEGKILQLLLSALEEGDTFKVREQDLTTPLYQFYLMSEDKNDITLTSNIPVDTQIIPVSAGHGFTTDDHLAMFDQGLYIQSQVKEVAGNNITISSPTANAFTTNATIIRGRIDLAIDPGTFKDFKCFSRYLTVPVDIQSVKINMIHTLAGDDGKFGSIAALTNGLRFRKTNTIIWNLGNFQDNGEFDDFGAEVSYPENAPAGQNATRIFFDLKKIYGNPIRLDPTVNDCLFARVQDDLSGLERLRISIMGQFTLGE